MLVEFVVCTYLKDITIFVDLIAAEPCNVSACPYNSWAGMQIVCVTCTTLCKLALSFPNPLNYCHKFS